MADRPAFDRRRRVRATAPAQADRLPGEGRAEPAGSAQKGGIGGAYRVDRAKAGQPHVQPGQQIHRAPGNARAPEGGRGGAAGVHRSPI